jgi:hypothetical protein
MLMKLKLVIRLWVKKSTKTLIKSTYPNLVGKHKIYFKTIDLPYLFLGLCNRNHIICCIWPKHKRARRSSRLTSEIVNLRTVVSDIYLDKQVDKLVTASIQLF